MRLREPRAIASLFPRGVICAETLGDEPVAAPLYPDEAMRVARAVPRRRREFARGRDCARRALAELGVAPGAIPVGPCREPIWPSGFVGSITHTDDYCAAVVGPGATFAALGVDAECNEPLPGGVLERVAGIRERGAIAVLPGTCVSWDRLLFSAKESVLKCLYALTETWIDFQDAEVVITPDPATLERGTFEARISTACSRAPRPGIAFLCGAYVAADGLIVTGVAAPCSPSGPALM